MRNSAVPRNQLRTSSGRSTPLRQCVEAELNSYFEMLDGQKPSSLHKMVVEEAEQALLEVVLGKTGGNQTLAAEYLGISRGTLRKKMRCYAIE